MIVDFLKQWGILHWEIAQTPYHLVTLLPGTPSACHPTAQTSYQPVTLLLRHPISLSPSIPRHPIAWTPYLTRSYLTLNLSHSPYLTLTLSHLHPVSLTPYLISSSPNTLSHCHPISQDTLLPGHPISLAPISLSTYLTLPISLSPYLTYTLSHSHPISSHLAQTPYHHVTLLPGTRTACHPVTPDTLLPGHPISLTPYLTLTLSHTLSHSDPISLSPYLAHTLISLSPISLSPYLTHTLSRSHPICVLPYRPCAQEVTEGMLELEWSRIETATELEQLHDQKDNLQEHLNMLKHTLIMVTLSHECTLRHASLRLCFCLFLQICCTFKRSFPSDKEKCHQNLYLIFDWKHGLFSLIK